MHDKIDSLYHNLCQEKVSHKCDCIYSTKSPSPCLNNLPTPHGADMKLAKATISDINRLNNKTYNPHTISAD